MRTKFLVIFSIFFTIAGVCFAKDKQKKQRPIQPEYVHSKPLRIKPVFDKPVMERGNRVRPVFEKSFIERPVFAKKQMDKPRWDKDTVEKPQWDETLLETKAITGSEKIHEASPVEKKSDSKVKRGWFRNLRHP